MHKRRFVRRGPAFTAAMAMLAAATWALSSPGSALGSKARVAPAARPEPRVVPADPALPPADPARPLTVVVRGWLWEPESRRNPPELSYFPEALNAALRSRYGLETTIYQYHWSRIPKDLPAATRDFTEFASALAARAAASGRCVNFIGHSAGALIVYSAAGRGVPMGYMGTVGLPNAGSAKPASVALWTNFYTKDRRDLAGIVWGSRMAADRNVEAIAPHKEMWSATAVIQGSAEGIAEAWATCRP